jgi:hypothetical protein
MVETVFELDGQVVENTSYWERPDGWNLEVVSGFLGAVNTFIQSDLMPLLTNTITLVRLIGTLLDTAEALSYTLTVSPPVAGTATGTPLPNNSTYTVSFLTAGRGRSNRGRNYVPGIPVAGTASQNRVDADFRTGLLAYYEGLKALGVPSSTFMVVVSRFSGIDSAGKPIPREVGVTNNITSFATFDDVLDSQRRRLPGRGA